jgi:hypothetical protein
MNAWSYTHRTLYTFVTWYLIKYRVDFTFTVHFQLRYEAFSRAALTEIYPVTPQKINCKPTYEQQLYNMCPS